MIDEQSKENVKTYPFPYFTDMVWFKIFSFLNPSYVYFKISLVSKAFEVCIRDDEMYWRSLRSLVLRDKLKRNFNINIIPKCPNLTYLTIVTDENVNSANIPRYSLPNLKTLNYLCLGYRLSNSFLEHILKGAPKINTLRLYGYFSFYPLTEVSLLSELTSWEFYNFKEIEGNKQPILDVVTKCKLLKDISISCLTSQSDENIIGNIIELTFENLTSLTWECELNEDHFTNISKCTQITTLKLDVVYSNASDKSLQVIKLLPNLHTFILDVKRLFLTNLPPRAFTQNGFINLFSDGSLPQLRVFGLTMCENFNEACLKALTMNCRLLETLYFEDCPLVTNRSIDYVLTYSKALRVLRIHMSEGIYSFVTKLPGQLPHLSCLCLPSNSVNFDLVKNFAREHPEFKVIKSALLNFFDGLNNFYPYPNELAYKSVLMFKNTANLVEMFGHPVKKEIEPL